MKIQPLGAQLFYVDRRTDMMKLIVAFRNFANAPKNKHAQISNFMKIQPLGAQLFYVDRRMDMTKLIVAFRNFANAPKNKHTYLLSGQNLEIFEC
jgi:hypothetical protein